MEREARKVSGEEPSAAQGDQGAKKEADPLGPASLLYAFAELDCEWVLAWIELTCWEWSADILYAEHLESLEENLATVVECVCTMVWETLANEDVTIEACEAWDSVDTDTTERA